MCCVVVVGGKCFAHTQMPKLKFGLNKSHTAVCGVVVRLVFNMRLIVVIIPHRHTGPSKNINSCDHQTGDVHDQRDLMSLFELRLEFMPFFT